MHAPAPGLRGRVVLERLALAGLVAYGAVLLFVLGPLGDAVGTSSAGGPPGVAAVEGEGQAAPAGALPELAPGEAARAVALMRADGYFRGLVAGRDFTVEKLGPWTTAGAAENGAKRLLGASMIVSFTSPISIERKPMPGALYDQTERRTPPYQEVVNSVDATGVSELMVLVDLDRGKVVNISPGPDSRVLRVTPPPGFRRTVPPQSEGGN